MSIIRRSAGLGILLLSVVGLILCTAGIAGVWMGKSRLDHVVEAVFGTADDAFEFMETKLDRVNQALERSRQRVTVLSRLTARLKTTEADLSTEFEPLLQTLDGVYGELQSAEHWLDASQAIAGGVHRVSDAVVRSEAADPDESDRVTA